MCSHAAQVAENALDQREVMRPRIVHVETRLLHGVRHVRAGQGDVLKGTH